MLLMTAVAMAAVKIKTMAVAATMMIVVKTAH